MDNHVHVRPRENGHKLKNNWENVSSKKKNPQGAFLSVLVYHLKIKYKVPVCSVRYYWIRSYWQNRWVCVYHCLTFHHVLMFDSRGAFLSGMIFDEIALGMRSGTEEKMGSAWNFCIYKVCLTSDCVAND